MKNCNICEIDKEDNEFSSGRNQCKLCIRDKKRNYYHENIEREKLRLEKYRNENKDKIKESDLKYYQNNSDKVKERVKLYRLKNPEAIKKRRSDYYNNNKEKIKDRLKANESTRKEKRKVYTENNKDKINEYQRIYLKNRRKVDPLFKLSCNISSLIRQLFKNNGFKKGKTIDIIGCSFDNFKLHLESKFESWMNWENYGLYNGDFNYGWDIDHVIPTSSAKNEEELINLNNYSNMQPLCSKINRDIKVDKINFQISPI